MDPLGVERRERIPHYRVAGSPVAAFEVIHHRREGVAGIRPLLLVPVEPRLDVGPEGPEIAAGQSGERIP